VVNFLWIYVGASYPISPSYTSPEHLQVADISLKQGRNMILNSKVICPSFMTYSSHVVYNGVTWPFYQYWSFLQHGGEVWTSVGSSAKIPALFTRKNVHYLHTVKTAVLRTECTGFSGKWGSINFNGQWACVRSELDYTFNVILY